MSKKGNFLTVFLFGVLIIGVLASVVLLSGNYLGSKKEKTGINCPQVGQEHFVTIKDNKMEPQVTQANLCDKLTITNQDDKLRRVAFGEHEEHIAYNGTVEKILRKGQSFSVTLNEAGNYNFHDHLQEEVQAEFSIK